MRRCQILSLAICLIVGTVVLPPPSITVAQSQPTTRRCDNWESEAPNTTFICQLVSDERVGGDRFRVYFPATETSRPGKPSQAWQDRRAKAIKLTNQAIADSVRVYRGLRHIEFPADITFGTTKDLDANAIAFSSTPCQIVVRSNGLQFLDGSEKGENFFRQLIAHELFHCFQFKAFPRQSHIDNVVSSWWIEGSAEYFSNVVYSKANLEWQNNIEALDQSQTGNNPISLIELSQKEHEHKSFLFFQYLSQSQGGDEVRGRSLILQLMDMMPTVDHPGQDQDFREMWNTTSGWPQIHRLFHEYNQKYLDRSIQDTGGNIRMQPPATSLVPGTPEIVQSGRSYPLESFVPFQLKRYRYLFLAGNRYAVRVRYGNLPEHLVQSSMKLSVQVETSAGTWRPLADGFTIGCEEQRRDYVLLMTSTARHDVISRYGGVVQPTLEVAAEPCSRPPAPNNAPSPPRPAPPSSSPPQRPSSAPQGAAPSAKPETCEDVGGGTDIFGIFGIAIELADDVCRMGQAAGGALVGDGQPSRESGSQPPAPVVAAQGAANQGAPDGGRAPAVTATIAATPTLVPSATPTPPPPTPTPPPQAAPQPPRPPMAAPGQPVPPSTQAAAPTPRTQTEPTPTAPVTPSPATPQPTPPTPRPATAADAENLGVSKRFAEFWATHGGTALLGNPLTGELEQQLGDGKIYTVQFFERALLVHHPEHVGTVLKVQFAPLGRLVRPQDPPASRLADNVYFPETGHNLGSGFLAYWNEHGGLSQFGYPISEELTERLDDGTERTVQYFEHTRFEWHAEAQPASRVQVSALGQKVLEQRHLLQAQPSPTAQPRSVDSSAPVPDASRHVPPAWFSLLLLVMIVISGIALCRMLPAIAVVAVVVFIVLVTMA